MEYKLEEDLKDWEKDCLECYKSYGNCCIIEELPECEIDTHIKEIKFAIAEQK